jgi:hypothetical protein
MTKFETLLAAAVTTLSREGWTSSVSTETWEYEDVEINDKTIPEGVEFIRHTVSGPPSGAGKHAPTYGPDVEIFAEYDCYRITVGMDWGVDTVAEGSLSAPDLSLDDLVALMRKAECDSREACA